MGEWMKEYYTQHHLHMHDVFLSFLSLHGIQVQQRIKEKEEGK
jgi:hypothetical protein